MNQIFHTCSIYVARKNIIISGPPNILILSISSIDNDISSQYIALIMIYPPNIEWLVLCCGQLCINRLGYQGLNPIHSRNTDQGYLVNYIFCSNRKRSRIFVYGKWYILEQQKEITFKLNFKISLWWFTILFTFRVAGLGLNCYCLNCNWLQNKQKLQKSSVHAPISSHSIYL